MKKLWLLLLMVTPLRLIHAQEVKHAPTVEQCRAEQKLWLSQLAEPNVSHVSFTQLRDGGIEMSQCEDVDQEGERANIYATTAVRIQLRLGDRCNNFLARHHLSDQFLAEDAPDQRWCNNFLVRHNLWDQFLAEDAQGKR